MIAGAGGGAVGGFMSLVAAGGGGGGGGGGAGIGGAAVGIGGTSMSIMANVTLAASSALGIYCKVLVGDAKFRSEMVGMVTDCILRWMAVNRGRCFLFGKRAWNAHLSDRTLEESTTDVDMILYDPETFPSMTLDLLRVITEECGPALTYMHSFTKTHMDKRGKTFTVEICGVSVADLSMRTTPGDFRLVAHDAATTSPAHSPLASGQPLPPYDHFSVQRTVHLTTGERIRVSVLRVRVMESMLEAEISSYHWRKDKAEKELRKYMMFGALGFVAAEEDELVEEENKATQSTSKPKARDFSKTKQGRGEQGRAEQIRGERPRQRTVGAGPRQMDAGRETVASEDSVDSDGAASAASSDGAASAASSDGAASAASSDGAASAASSDGLADSAAASSDGLADSAAASSDGLADSAAAIKEAMQESSFQLPVLAQYIRQCGTLEECKRIATTLFYWREGDEMHACVSSVCAARTVEECRAIAKQILDVS